MLLGRRWPRDINTLLASVKLVAQFADAVNQRLRDRLASTHPDFDWRTEARVGRTPVDVLGVDDGQTVLVEFESRRADPATNAVKLFRHFDEGTLDAPEAILFHVFSAYYDLSSGGVSSKRKDAEFVGRVAADALAGLAYHPLNFDLIPPKSGVNPPIGWRDVTDEMADRIATRL